MSNIGRGLTQFSQGIEPGIQTLLQALQRAQQQKAGAAGLAGLAGLAGMGDAQPSQGGPPPVASPAPNVNPPTPNQGRPGLPGGSWPPPGGGGAPPGLSLSGGGAPPGLSLSGGGTGGRPPGMGAGGGQAGAPNPIQEHLKTAVMPTAAAGQFGLTDQLTSGAAFITQVGEAIKKANPGIKPAELLSATQQAIEMTKGIAPETKAAASNQIAMYKAMLGHDDKVMGEEGKDARFDKGEEGKDRRAKLGADTKVTVAGIGARARVSAADISAAARRYASDNSLRGSEDATAERGTASAASTAERGDAADAATLGREAAALTGDSARVLASALNAGQPLDQAVALAKQFEQDHATSLGGASPVRPPAAHYKAPGPSGRAPIQDKDIRFLKQNRNDPAWRKAFDAKFGPGAAAAALK